MAERSRGTFDKGLPGAQWVTLFELGHGYGDPPYWYHQLAFSLQNEVVQNDTETPANRSVKVLVQTSADGTTWTTAYTYPNLVVPGGEAVISTSHNQKYVRAVAYSDVATRVWGQWLPPEMQSTPHFEEPDSLVASGACVTFCEVDCETGTETAN